MSTTPRTPTAQPSTADSAPPCTSSLSFPPDEVSKWRRIRRYAVPRWMIEQATERRLAGDWRGACAAANVDVNVDLSDITKEHGRKTAAAVEDDLHHFAPDLLRWHLPRNEGGRTTVVCNQVVVLGSYGRAMRSRRQNAPRLHVTTPGWIADGPQRLTLRFGQADPVHQGIGWWRGNVENWAVARQLWDVRHAAELRERCGGGHDRAPFLNADGTLRGAAQLPRTDPGRTDPAARTEWVTLLREKGEVKAAFVAAGIELHLPPVTNSWNRRVEPLELLKKMPLALTQLRSAIQRLASEDDEDHFFFWPFGAWNVTMLFERKKHDGGLRARCVELDEAPDVVLPETCWRLLPDLDLLRHGHITPEHLHPLVRDALAPGHPVVDGPTGPPDAEPPAPVRVRCRGAWHEMSFRDGSLHIPHSDEEQRREGAMRAFGGATVGCFAAQQAWRSGIGWLPRALRDQQKELFARAQHGDTPGVIRLLDAGVAPHARDGRQRTLLHLLHLVDHERLLPRLLAAGLDIEATDQDGRTPLHVIVGEGGSAELVRALLTAGARIDVTDNDTGLFTLHRLIGRRDRADLWFLKDMLERNHPDLCSPWNFRKERT